MVLVDIVDAATCNPLHSRTAWAKVDLQLQIFCFTTPNAWYHYGFYRKGLVHRALRAQNMLASANS